MEKITKENTIRLYVALQWSIIIPDFFLNSVEIKFSFEYADLVTNYIAFSDRPS